MAARLKRDVKPAAAGPRAGPAQGHHLGVGLAGAAMEAFPDQLTIGIEHDAAHQGVGTGLALSQGSQGQGPAHPVAIRAGWWAVHAIP